MKKPKEPDFFSKQVARARRFYIEGSQTSDSRMKVVCGGCEHTQPEFEINRKDFPYYSIEFVAKGSGQVTLKGDSYALEPGVVFSYGPGVSQYITSNPDKPMIKYFIDFTGSGAKQSVEQYLSPLGTAIRINRTDEVVRILDELITHGLSDSPYKAMICSSLLEYLIYRLADMTVSTEGTPDRAFITYQHCRQYIKEHFVKLNSLEDIALACSIDGAYLCRLFRKYDTQSPYQYLLHLKMAYAAQCFQQPEMLVKEVAFKLGFSDPFHFTRAFKKVFGICPQAFKQLR